MKDYRSLQVWQRSHELTVAVYKATQDFPSDERYGLTSQLRRSAVSIPSNIAEGCGRGSDIDFARCCQIAMGSVCEVNYQLLLARELNYVTDEDHKRLDVVINKIQRMLTALIARLRP